MKRIAALASGQGTNLEAILRAAELGEISGRVTLVVSDIKDAPALERSRCRGIRSVFIDPSLYRNRREFDAAVITELDKEKIELVVLAGFMRLLSPMIIEKYSLRIMNIHPTLLPAFPGSHGVEQALAYGVKVTGCTVHFVDEGMDTGPVILQSSVPVLQVDTVETLRRRINAAEHRIYPRAVELFCRDKLKVEGRRCIIIG